MDLGWKFGVSLGPLEGEPEIQGGSVVSGGKHGEGDGNKTRWILLICRVFRISSSIYIMKENHV